MISMRIILVLVMFNFGHISSRPQFNHFERNPADIKTITTTTTTTEEPKPVIPIIKDERNGPLRGNFHFDFETGDGIKRTEQGNSAGIRKGVITFPLPDGQIFELKFVAGPNGFQPESDFLPKAPEFPHPIPEHAKEQLRLHG